MRWSADGALVVTTLFDAATFHYSVMPVCRCGHSARFEACGLWWHFERRGWDDRLTDARKRFCCTVCHASDRRKMRPTRLELVGWCESDLQLPLPDERTWKQIMRQVR